MSSVGHGKNDYQINLRLIATVTVSGREMATQVHVVSGRDPALATARDNRNS